VKFASGRFKKFGGRNLPKKIPSERPPRTVLPGGAPLRRRLLPPHPGVPLLHPRPRHSPHDHAAASIRLLPGSNNVWSSRAQTSYKKNHLFSIKIIQKIFLHPLRNPRSSGGPSDGMKPGEQVSTNRNRKILKHSPRKKVFISISGTRSREWKLFKSSCCIQCGP